MAIKVEGFLELENQLEDMEISDRKKKDVLHEAASYAQKKVEAATFERTGRLKRSWRTQYQRLDGNWSIRLYSRASHDIYNEFGSSSNKAHIGFFSNTIDQEFTKITDIMAKGVSKT